MGSAQYKRVAFPSGSTQHFPTNSVSISHTGPAQTFLGHTCSYGPYQIGYIVAVIILNFYSPFEYHYNFANPVRHVRVDIGDLAYSDAIGLEINGVPYFLTNGNLQPSSPTCQRGTAIVAGGMLMAPPGAVYGNEAAGLLHVNMPTGVNDLTVAFVGPITTNGYTGTYFSVMFGEVEARNSGPVCEGSMVQLIGDSTITEPGSFYWAGPNGYTSTQQHPALENLSPADTGIYTFRYIGGTDTLTDTTYVGLLPGPDQPVITANANPICLGETLELSAASSAGAVFNWRGPRGLNATGAVQNMPGVRPSHAGRYIVTATQYTCSKKDSIDITVASPVAKTIARAICMNDSYDFNGRQLYEAGVYVDTLTAANGCDSVIQLQLTVHPNPEVRINVLREVMAKPCLGDVIDLEAAGATSYNWYHNEIDLGNVSSLQLTVTDLQNRFVLAGADDHQCRDTSYLDLEADDCCKVAFPSAFTPNGDGKNDRLGAIPSANTKVTNYSLKVFNRLGQQVYITNDISDKWDGTYKGIPAETGVYYFTYGYECYGGNKIQKMGDVTLLR